MAERDPQVPRKKQTRNKPTLSCEQCVERKTKCDRGRPRCVACAKRQSECRYSEIANRIASSDRGIVRRARKHSKSALGQPTDAPPVHDPKPQQAQAQAQAQPPPRALSSPASSPFLLSNIPYSNLTPSPFFGAYTAEHPFANYWTSRGGLAEVIGVLPERKQADILVDKYFEAVDPVYPLIHRRAFYTDYERFWSLPLEEKAVADPALVALHFVVYAMGMQFIPNYSNHEIRQKGAEFYISASQQALRLSGYLSRASLKSLQAMVLICYFLMNDNHASDAWQVADSSWVPAFGGVLARQAYAMGLHRDPDIIAPRSSQVEKHQRRKLWQAIFFQDTFLTVLLKLPPTTTFADVRVESLTDDLDDHVSNGMPISGTPEVVMNPMSISNIVPMSEAYPPHEIADRQYIRSMWRMANLTQRAICTPRSLDNPLTTSPEDRKLLIRQYQDLMESFPPLLTTFTEDGIRTLAHSNPRHLRQNFFFRSNFWHCLMIINADENVVGGVTCDVEGALHAARMALLAFFHFWQYLRVDVGVWWVFQHRAFEEALLMVRILAAQKLPLHQSQSGMSAPSSIPLFAQAREDAQRALEILEHIGSASEMQKTRTEVLRKELGDIAW
ncbi:uncharacterized protein EI97DRAFT_464506 [Westerdykella ornata]|uniref:Zn(2)-C6 fungal-type domain-containing protein n=1 Tax=Westerdykella ornata TaxID=318751 RepID=A0A6A6JRK1_WESOR|nr:uncharacterized protein EI97DRAFT_464506 [Westerdykella ornata]KAF2279192.1 hypothetical protein EI97DRAFT_464506 [Westerdykella ornata]